MANRQSKDKSRAEKMRSRKQSSPKAAVKAPIKSSATRKQNKYRVPVTRRTTPPMPVISHKRNKVRVPLKAKGVELHLPAFPRLQIGWRIISGAIFLLSLIVVISFSSLNAFRVAAIDLHGALRLDSASVYSQLDLAGKSIIEVKPREIAADIESSFPGLNSVRVSTSLPANVTVRVTERQPIILWQQNDASFWMDAEGVMFPIRGEAEVALTVMANGAPPLAPTAKQALEETETTVEESSSELFEEAELLAGSLSGKINYPRTTTEFVLGILTLGQYVPEGSYLQYDPQFGLGWQDPKGWTVYFGKDIANIDIKLAEYQRILAALNTKGITPTLISVEFLQAPFYRVE